MPKLDAVADLIFRSVRNEPKLTRAKVRDYLELYADTRDAERLTEISVALPKAVPGGVPTDKAAVKAGDTKKQEHVFTGRGSAEKREIHDRLLAYREANGIGCLAPLAAAAKGVSQEDLRMMLGSAPMPLPKWIAVGKALDKIEKAAPSADTPETAKQN